MTKPVATREGKCPECPRWFKLKGDGTVHWHRKGGDTCRGEGAWPTNIREVADAKN